MTEPARATRATRATRGSQGSPWFAVAAGVVVAAIALATIAAVPIGVFWDDGVYLIGAKAMATGAGYRMIHLPGAPPAVHFPPAWPALLAVLWRVGGASEGGVLLRVANPLLLGTGAALACLYAVRRLALPPLVACVAAVAFGAALPQLVIAGVLFSEPLFLAVLVISLFLADDAVERGGWRRALAAGATAGVLTLVRSAGIALVPAVVVALLARRRGREAGVAAAGAMAVLAPWQAWIATHARLLPAPLQGSYGPYADWVLGLYRQRGTALALITARVNILAVMRSLGIALFPFGPREIRPLLVTLVLVIGSVAVIRARHRAQTAIVFLGLYVAVVLVWPYAPDRFMWAVWPLLGMLLASGAVECWRIGSAHGAVTSVRATCALACTIGVFAIGGHAGYTARGVGRHWWDSAAVHNADALIPVADWINANTRPEDVVAVDGEPFVYLQTGRTVVPVHILSPDEYFAGTPVERAAADLRALLVTGHPRYAVFSGAAGERDIAPMLDGRDGSPRLERIATIPGGGTAYRVVMSP